MLRQFFMSYFILVFVSESKTEVTGTLSFFENTGGPSPTPWLLGVTEPPQLPGRGKACSAESSFPAKPFNLQPHLSLKPHKKQWN